MASTYYTIGSKGDEVKNLQQQLKSAGYDPGGIDGIFGKNTAAAVTAYQKAKGLAVDGIAGTQTLTSLNSGANPVASAPKVVASAATSTTPGSTPVVDPDRELAKRISNGEISGDAMNAAIKNLASGNTAGSSSPYGDLSGLNNLNMAAPTSTAYKSPYEDKINALLDKYLSYDLNTPYDVTSDPMYAPLKQSYEQAGETAFQDTMGDLSSLTGGRVNTWAASAASQAKNKYAQDFSANVLPSLINQEQTRRQNAYANLANQLSMLQGLDATNYSRGRDALSDARTAEETERQRYIDTIGQFYENYQAEYNKIRDDGDPSNDWQLPIIAAARQEKMQGQNAASSAAQGKAYENALALWKTLGTATPEIANILGVPVNAKTSDYNIDLISADIAKMNAATSRMNANTSAQKVADLTTLGTPEQLNYFNNAFNYLLEKNGGDGYKAYQQLLRESKDYNASMGTKLYAELGKQLQAYGKSQGTPTSINNATTFSVDDLSSIIKTRFVKPATQISEQEINYQGIADFLEQLINAGADTRKTDELARLWGLNID